MKKKGKKKRKRKKQAVFICSANVIIREKWVPIFWLLSSFSHSAFAVAGDVVVVLRISRTQ